MPRRFMSFAAFLLLAGCAGAQPAGTTSAILPEEIVAKLQPGDSDLAPDLYYVSDAAAGRHFDKVLIDPITYFAPLEDMRSLSPEDRQTTLNNLQILLARHLLHNSH